MNDRRDKISTLRGMRTFVKKGACSSAACHLINQSYGHSLDREERAAGPLAGGISQHGYQCGFLWGAALAAGAQAHQLYGSGARAETAAMEASQRVAVAFRDRFEYTDCYDLIEFSWKTTERLAFVKYFLRLRGGPLNCFRMAGPSSQMALEVLDDVLATEPEDVPAPPVSCTAEFARKMGMSELQVSMAAGLAGGIGLSGGGCGVLGAATWIFGLQSDEPVSYDLSDPRIEAIVVMYLEASDYEFECSGVVGREFSSVADHAEHVRGGGCAEIVDAMVAGLSGSEPASN